MLTVLLTLLMLPWLLTLMLTLLLLTQMLTLQMLTKMLTLLMLTLLLLSPQGSPRPLAVRWTSSTAPMGSVFQTGGAATRWMSVETTQTRSCAWTPPSPSSPAAWTTSPACPATPASTPACPTACAATAASTVR